LGKIENELCVSSKDCNPGLYCDRAGGSNRCKKFKGRNEACLLSEECGRGARCWFKAPEDRDDNDKDKGKCTSYFNVLDGERVYINSEYDVFLCKSGLAESESNS